MLFVLANMNDAYAYSIPKYLRVGLTYKYQEVDSVPISNKQILVGFEASGEFSGQATVNASNSFSVRPVNLYYARIEQVYSSMSDAQSMVNTLGNTGYNAACALVDLNKWYVYVGGYSTASDINTVISKLNTTCTVVQPSNRTVELLDGNKTIIVFDASDKFPQVMAYNDKSSITVGDRTYRGRIEFGRYAGKKMTAVNVILFDQYLYASVPSEMPQTWHMEALKAQALVARNYTITRMGIHASEGFDVCDSTHCEAYKGFENETDNSRLAVDSISNLLIYYNNVPINAVFFSSSGGYTEDSENVWANAIPYMRGVPEINEYSSKEWTRSFTISDLTNLLTKNNVNIGTATNIKIGQKSRAGRVNELIIQGTNGTKSLTKEDIRTFFLPTGTSLESRNFDIVNGSGVVQSRNTIPALLQSDTTTTQKNISAAYVMGADGNVSNISDKTGTIYMSGNNGIKNYGLTSAVTVGDGNKNSFVFMGKGWGHGVGMSQFGAKGMAEMGYTFDQIIKYYFTGVEIK